MVEKLCKPTLADTVDAIRTVALSGGCFHNAVLLRLTEDRLLRNGFDVLTQSSVPSGDGGLALTYGGFTVGGSGSRFASLQRW